MEFFGKKLAELREQKNLSQDELATELQLSQSTISNYEKGTRKIDVESLQKICDYFNVPITYMLSDEKVVFHSIENHGENHGNFVNTTINTMSDKLIELYELRLKEKDEIISFLKKEIERIKGEK